MKVHAFFFISTAIFWPRLICCLGIMKEKAQNLLNCCLVIYSGQNQKNDICQQLNSYKKERVSLCTEESET